MDRALQRHTGIIELTRLRWKSCRKSAVGVQAEKQNLNDTFELGHMLQDVCDSLPKSAVLSAKLPFEIRLRSGKWFVAGSPVRISTDSDAVPGIGNREFLANLRIEAELMMFIGQTAMNATQACRLTLRRFSYVSHNDSYEVSEYKGRGSRTVLFEIFKEYKSHFERFLEWRRALFPNSTLLFPFIRYGSRPGSSCDMARIRAICAELNLTFVGPRLLRNTRVNWMLRRTGDPDVTAETSQHTKKTLLRNYHQPSLQRTMSESTKFWVVMDAHLTKKESVAPGECTGTPKEEASIAKQAPKPNCGRKSGCLWCVDHRDIDSFDYVWALASFCQMKLYELTKVDMRKLAEDAPPAQLAVDRIQEKLSWFKEASEERREWVTEARARIAEGWYHPDFEAELAALEGVL
ncbi:site-specific integrase [Paraburkholderia azotifigens]|uniref:Site-specific integrase n=1 Tax=Paraburkholderia azotifigens TaxID=2057004 RepID=A0A5C6VVC5_9BURK|nr:site-specific integrase [Paraburkholderia azotifigens]TXC88464.1 site-specific integrase [Paraburkholderia azotifigens]